MLYNLLNFTKNLKRNHQRNSKALEITGSFIGEVRFSILWTLTRLILHGIFWKNKHTHLIKHSCDIFTQNHK